MLLLALDVGNTQTVVGLYDLHPAAGANEERRLADSNLIDHWRIATNAERTADEHALVLQEFLGFHGSTWDDHDIQGIAVCSSVPRVTGSLRRMSERYFGFPALVVEPGVRTGLPILYDNPKEVGADRIADAVGAFDLYGGPTIVIDFGTATTFEAISAKGEYLGGAIFPGIDISLDALFARAAALRRVELVEPRSVIGRSTVESIQSGVIYGYTTPGRRHVRADPGRARRRGHRRRHRRPVGADRTAVGQHRPRRAVAHAARPAPHPREERHDDRSRTGSR